MADQSQQDQLMENAKRAGWNPKDGEPPFEHGDFKEGLASGDSIEDLEDPDDAAG